MLDMVYNCSKPIVISDDNILHTQLTYIIKYIKLLDNNCSVPLTIVIALRLLIYVYIYVCYIGIG